MIYLCIYYLFINLLCIYLFVYLFIHYWDSYVSKMGFDANQPAIGWLWLMQPPVFLYGWLLAQVTSWHAYSSLWRKTGDIHDYCIIFEIPMQPAMVLWFVIVFMNSGCTKGVGFASHGYGY